MNVFGRVYRRRGTEVRFGFLYLVRSRLRRAHSRDHHRFGPSTGLDRFQGEVQFCRVRGVVRLNNVRG